VAAFEEALLTADEQEAGLGQFLGRDDGLDPWLGHREPDSLG
jgi:hypothetical protein